MGILLRTIIYVEFNDGELDGASFSNPIVVKEYTSKPNWVKFLNLITLLWNQMAF